VLWADASPEEADAALQEIRSEAYTMCIAGNLSTMWGQLRERQFDLLIADDFRFPFDGEWMKGFADLAAAGIAPPWVIVRHLEASGRPVEVRQRFMKGDEFALAVFDGDPEVLGEERLEAILSSLVTAPGLLVADGETPEVSKAALVSFQKVSDSVHREFIERPERLSQMHWRDFECLVADLFDRNGWKVTLTPARGDRGVDLYVARHSSLGRLLYVIECKRHRLDRPVGPEIVRQLRGVVDREKATAGVLVTTSSFSKGAWEEQKTLPMQLLLRDGHDVQAWLGGAPIQ
jgi:HJR/Mrr/RecB family endonuclease